MKDKSPSLMALHACSGCDSTSIFCGISKLKPEKTILLSREHMRSLIGLGDSWGISGDTVEKLESLPVYSMGMLPVLQRWMI